MNTDCLRVVRLKSYNKVPYVDEVNEGIISQKQIQFYNDIYAIYEETYASENIKINGKQTYGEIIFIKIVDGEFYGLSIEETDLVIDKLKEILDNIQKQHIKEMKETKPSNKIYYLETAVFFTEFFDGELERAYKNLYYTLASARNEGTEWLKKIIKALCYQIDYFNLRGKEEEFKETVENYMDFGMMQYKFTITEVEPLYASSYCIDKTKEECILNDKPTEIIHFYNYDGTLKYKVLQWKNNFNQYAHYAIRFYEGDELEEAGKKFKVGDFVTIRGDYLSHKYKSEYTFFYTKKDYIAPSEIFVIKSVPIKKDGKFVDGNKYCISRIINNKISNIVDVYEHDIEAYDGTIDDKSPYMILSKIYKNEINVSDDIAEIIKFVE